MKFYCFGETEKPVLLLLPGTCCHWKENFGEVIPLLEPYFHVVCVSYDGFDETESTEFPDMMPHRPDVESLADYYAKAMMTKPMKWFCRGSGKAKYTPKDIAGMKATAALKAADRNPYSWNMDFYEYPDGSGYEGRFTKCGICTLMKELGLYDLTPAMCRLDYTMSEAGGVMDFVREYTLASGGPYCDCGYKKKK